MLSEFQSIEDEMIRRHWQEWLDARVPALGNKTTRQAARTPGGRERLEALLAEFERDAERQPSVAAHLAAIRDKLGLPKPTSPEGTSRTAGLLTTSRPRVDAIGLQILAKDTRATFQIEQTASGHGAAQQRSTTSRRRTTAVGVEEAETARVQPLGWRVCRLRTDRTEPCK
jgi:hypothetical protein